jgi:ketosteroid isomerase-like protein
VHPNEQLLTTLFQCLNAHDHMGAAECYHDEATFRDIAFTLKGKRQIHAMWDMACSVNKKGIPSDIKATVQQLSANDATGKVLVDFDYTFRDTGRKVHNPVESTYHFRDGKIIQQTDKADAANWARQAFGGFNGWVAGRFDRIRRNKAMDKLKAERPEAFK